MPPRSKRTVHANEAKAGSASKNTTSAEEGKKRKAPAVKEEDEHVDENPAPKGKRRRTKKEDVVKEEATEDGSEAPSTPAKKQRAPRKKKVFVAQPRSEKTLAKARLIAEVLERSYPNPPCPLDYQDEFQLLCAVMLSAQTTDGKVNQVTPALFAAAPTPETMAAMEFEDVLRIIRTVGLAPTKSRNLIASAKLLVERFQGRVPRTYEELESLPGVGHKTASVIMCEAFKEPSFPVDTHIHRLALRWLLTMELRDVRKVEADLQATFPREIWNDVHLQMIYFGREHCQAKNHLYVDCPICSWAAMPNAPQPSSVEDIPQLKKGSPRKASKMIITYAERSGGGASSGEATQQQATVAITEASSSEAPGSEVAGSAVLASVDVAGELRAAAATIAVTPIKAGEKAV